MGDHTEAVRVEYNKEELAYEDLLEQYWNIYVGPSGNCQYRAAIWYGSEEERRKAEASIQKARSSGKFMPFQVAPGAVAIEPAGDWWDAEESHQHRLFGEPR